MTLFVDQPMQERILKDKHVACPFQIAMCYRQGPIALATAFFYETAGETFLITNWHNVTGKHPLTGVALSCGRIPLYMRAKLPVVDDSVQIEGARSFYFSAEEIAIEDDSGPLWFEHPEYRSVCDVVAIPVRRPTDWPAVAHVAANRIDETPIPISPGLKVILVGFPEGISTGPGLPVIKTGFLASMPGFELRLGGEFSSVGGMRGGISIPAIALDVHSVPGMSGSPVFGEYTGTWDPDDLDSGKLSPTSLIGTSRMFLGCHSSRLEQGTGLTICCTASAIEEICLARQRGRPFAKVSDETGFEYE